ncbi:MAG: sigma-70 family RNA polymerase sigma factor [Myxococcota bacterium]
MDRAQLVRDHGPGIYTICRRLTPDPDDAYQAVWARVFASLGRFDPEGAASLRTWLFTIAHRVLVDRHRRRAVRDRHAAAEPFEEIAVSPTVEHQLAERRRRARLDAALARLPDALRRVIVLHHLVGQPLAHIAEAEGVPVGTVKSRLHRGRAELARDLADLGPAALTLVADRTEIP